MESVSLRIDVGHQQQRMAAQARDAILLAPRIWNVADPLQHSEHGQGAFRGRFWQYFKDLGNSGGVDRSARDHVAGSYTVPENDTAHILACLDASQHMWFSDFDSLITEELSSPPRTTHRYCRRHTQGCTQQP